GRDIWAVQGNAGTKFIRYLHSSGSGAQQDPNATISHYPFSIAVVFSGIENILTCSGDLQRRTSPPYFPVLSAVSRCIAPPQLPVNCAVTGRLLPPLLHPVLSRCISPPHFRRTCRPYLRRTIRPYLRLSLPPLLPPYYFA
ncbi:hypothetical protein L9F63_022858, partial [Diploptera punctata]